MFRAPSQHEEYAASRRDWTNGTALPRRVTVRLGLQAKIILCFITLVTAALAASSWTFAKLNHDRLTDVMSEQTRQVATALALSSEQAVRDGHWDQLEQLGGELVKSRNIVFVSFLDATAKPMALSSRAAGFQLEDLSTVQHDTRLLMQVRPMKSPVLGEYIEMIAPIVAGGPGADDGDDNADDQCKEKPCPHRHANGATRIKVAESLNRVQAIP